MIAWPRPMAALRLGLAFAVLLATLLAPTLAQAAPGDLDRSFGHGGKVVEGFCAHASFSATVDRRDRIVAAGTNNHFDNFCLMRFRQNGTLDRSFGDGGMVVADFGTNEEGALSVAIDSRGRIVAAGRSFRAFAVARFKPDGSVDSSFGTDGEVTTAIGTRATAYTVAVDSRDRILAAGTSEFEKFALARYDTDGTLDSSFGTGGVVTTDFRGRGGGVFSLAIDSGNRIVAAGETFYSQDDDFALARYDPDGTLDPSFSGNGKVTTNFPDRGAAYSVAVRPHGRIVAAGYGDDRFVLVRYRPNGSLDRSFSHNGKVRTAIGAESGASSVGIDSRRRIVAAGSSDGDFALARYRRNGSLDRSFSGNGKVRPGFGPGASSMGIDSKNRIILQGCHSNTVIARFIGYPKH
jgi:uncharacterized delta-60 repeat protein